MPRRRPSSANRDPIRRPNRRPARRRNRLLRAALYGLVVLLGVPWLVVLALRFVPPPTTAFMLQHLADGGSVAHAWIDRPLMGQELALAVVASEDQKFPSHFGFDVDSIRDALQSRGTGEPLRGASTITQQVAKNLFLWPGRSWVRKGVEAYVTVLIEVTWPKRRILEVYLNIAEFGPGVYGAGVASAYFFDKPARDLSPAEAALLATVLPNPKVLRADRPTAYMRERQDWIANQMQRLRRQQALAAIW